MPREWVAMFGGHNIRVVNTWFSGAKLYVDGECKDSTSQLTTTSTTVPLLRTRLEDDGQAHEVTIFMRGVFTMKVKICVNGEQISGDRF